MLHLNELFYVNTTLTGPKMKSERVRMCICAVGVWAGSRGAGGSDRPGLAADGRAGRPLCGLRLPQGENHHHGGGPEPGRPPARGSRYR